MNFKKKLRKFFTLTRKGTGGFTLVEFLVVIAILAILAGVGTVGYSAYVKKAEESADLKVIEAINTAFASACLEQEIELNQITAAGISVTDNKLYGVSSVSVDGVSDDDMTLSIAKGFKLYYQGNEDILFKKENVNSLSWNAEKGTFETSSSVVDAFIVLDSGKVIKVDKDDMEAITNSTYADMTYDEIAAIFDNVGKSGETFASLVRTLTMQDKLTAVLLANGLVADAAAAEALSTQQTANGLQMVTAKYLAGSGDVDELLDDVNLGSSALGLLTNMVGGTGGTKTVSAIAVQYAMLESFAKNPDYADATVTYTTGMLMWKEEHTVPVNEFLTSDYANEDPIRAISVVQKSAKYKEYEQTEQYTKDKEGLVATLSILGDNTGTVSNPSNIDIAGYLNDGIRSSDAKDAITAVIGN